MTTRLLMKHEFPYLAVAVTVLLAASTPRLYAEGSIRLTCKGETDVQETDEDGKVTTKRVPAVKIVPGSTVIYTIAYEHIGDSPAEDVVITNPVPQNTVYVDGSAKGEDTRIVFSVDGGKTYGPADKLTVPAENGEQRAAQAADYTHIRWLKRSDLENGEAGTVSFKVRVK